MQLNIGTTLTFGRRIIITTPLSPRN